MYKRKIVGDKFYIDKEIIKKYLEQAFDEGWAGYKDLKEEVVAELVNKLTKEIGSGIGIEPASTTPFSAFGYVTSTPYAVTWNESTSINSSSYAVSNQVVPQGQETLQGGQETPRSFDGSMLANYATNNIELQFTV